MSAAVRLSHQAARCRVEVVVAGAPARDRPELGILRPVGLAQRGSERLPLVVVGDGHRDPRVAPALVVGVGGEVEVLRSRRRPAVAVAAQQRAVGGVLDQLLGPDGEGGVDHGRLDQRATIAPVTPLEGERQRDHAVEPGVRVADAVRRHRVGVGVAGEPGQPGGVLDHERERGVVPPRTVESEPGHAHHDQVGVLGPQRIDVDADLLEHPGRRVLDHHVARGRQSPQQVAPALVGEVEGDAALARVEAGEDAGLLPPVGLGEADAGEHPGAVGAAGRLDVQDLGPEQGEHLGAERAGPERGEVEHPEPGEREVAVGRRRVADGAPVGGSIGAEVAQPGRRGRVGQERRIEAVRAAGLVEAVPRVGDERAAGDDVVGRGDRGAVADRRVRDAERRSELEHLGGGVLGHPGRDVGLEVGPLGEELAVLGPLGVADHRAEVEPLLTRCRRPPRPARRSWTRRRAGSRIARTGTGGRPCRRT